MEVVLVTGGRDFNNPDIISQVLSGIEMSILIQGGARGADTLARRWAEKCGIHSATVNALWKVYDKGAGPKRNTAMLALQPTLCVAFPGGFGTANMVSQCESHGIRVIKVTTGGDYNGL